MGGSSGTANAALALDIYTRLGDLDGVANAANNLGARCYFEGRWDDATRLYTDARLAHERRGDPVNAALCASNAAEILVEQGHLNRAIDVLEDSLPVLRAANDRVGVAFASQVLGTAMIRAGERDAGVALLETSRAEYIAIGAKSAAVDTNVALAESLLLDGRPRDAIELLADLFRDQEVNGGHEPQIPPAHRFRGYALAQLGDLVGAESEMRSAMAAGRQHGARPRGRSGTRAGSSTWPRSSAGRRAPTRPLDATGSSQSWASDIGRISHNIDHSE